MANDGKELEGKVYDALSDHHKLNKSHFLRLYDQTSSGGRGHKQAGDFIWLLPNKPILVECKSTDRGADILTLVKGSKSSRDQVNRHKLWLRSDNPTVYIWGDIKTREIRAYEGKSVVAAVHHSGKGAEDLLRLIDVTGFIAIERLLSSIDSYYL